MRRSAFLDGVVDVTPALPANAVFGVITGVATVGVGLSPVAAWTATVVLFAGAAQLAAVELLEEAAPAAIVVLAALLVNLRYLMYSASIARYFRELPVRWRAVLPYFLVDLNFALAVARFEERPETDRLGYFLGTALAPWVVYVGGAGVGAFLGAGVPGRLHLDFAVPLLFLGLLVPAVDDRPTLAAAAVSGVVAVAGAGLPFELGLMVAAVVGIAAGVTVESGVGSWA